ncbi:tRNA (adenosine(37)-N6)-dimethylallyltransferase MiaA [Candidatus Bipolaricaulota bacterium]|nr:tRNA (adenosine(37)-N6)-dimethylallyltransferase MiaA [Candidatus Bipolaricaulota bacterium]
MKQADRVVVILGATAVGKSSVATELALRLGGEIVSADSRAFFRGLDIVTDKPSIEQRRGIPHHLIDVVPLTGKYDAMTFRSDVEALISEIESRGHLPIIVGGGTLYLRAILRGIFTGPSADHELRQALLREPSDELYARLQKVDPEAAVRIHANDRLRIVRALEVHTITGQPISDLQKEATPLPLDFAVFGLKMEREAHRQAIAARVREMLANGLIDEVRSLRAQGLSPQHQAYRTIGIPETAAFLDGQISRQDLEERLINNTWSLARRQMAWFKRNSSVTWIDVTGRSPQEVAKEIDRFSDREIGRLKR